MVRDSDYESRYAYTGLGTYEIEFWYDLPGDIVVIWVDDDGNETDPGDKVLGVDYEIVPQGGSTYVNVLIDFGTGGTLVFYREMSLHQLWRGQTGVPPDYAEVMTALDRTVRLIQQVFRGVAGALRLPASETGTMTIPPASVRRGGILGFTDDAAAEPVMVAGVSSAPVSTHMAPHLLAASNEEFRDDIGAAPADLGSIHTTEFTVSNGSAGWYTLFRTKQNTTGIVKISCYGDNVRDYITLELFGDEDTGESEVGIISSYRRGSVPGVSSLRWGDAGAGNGVCLQLYIDPDTDTILRVKADAFASRAADNGTDAFVMSGHTSTATDADGNAVSEWSGEYSRPTVAARAHDPIRKGYVQDLTNESETGLTAGGTTNLCILSPTRFIQSTAAGGLVLYGVSSSYVVTQLDSITPPFAGGVVEVGPEEFVLLGYSQVAKYSISGDSIAIVGSAVSHSLNWNFSQFAPIDDERFVVYEGGAADDIHLLQFDGSTLTTLHTIGNANGSYSTWLVAFKRNLIFETNNGTLYPILIGEDNVLRRGPVTYATGMGASVWGAKAADDEIALTTSAGYIRFFKIIEDRAMAPYLQDTPSLAGSWPGSSRFYRLSADALLLFDFQTPFPAIILSMDRQIKDDRVTNDKNLGL